MTPREPHPSELPAPLPTAYGEAIDALHQVAAEGNLYAIATVIKLHENDRLTELLTNMDDDELSL